MRNPLLLMVLLCFFLSASVIADNAIHTLANNKLIKTDHNATIMGAYSLEEYGTKIWFDGFRTENGELCHRTLTMIRPNLEVSLDKQCFLIQLYEHPQGYSNEQLSIIGNREQYVAFEGGNPAELHWGVEQQIFSFAERCFEYIDSVASGKLAVTSGSLKIIPKGNVKAVGYIGPFAVNQATLLPVATSTVGIKVNLNFETPIVSQSKFSPGDRVSYHFSERTRITDSHGEKHWLNFYFRRTAKTAWEVFILYKGKRVSETSLEFDASSMSLESHSKSLTIKKFQAQNHLGHASKAEPFEITVSFDGTQWVNGSNQTGMIEPMSANGYASTRAQSWQLDNHGEISVKYFDGQKRKACQISSWDLNFYGLGINSQFPFSYQSDVANLLTVSNSKLTDTSHLPYLSHNSNDVTIANNHPNKFRLLEFLRMVQRFKLLNSVNYSVDNSESFTIEGNVLVTDMLSTLLIQIPK